MDIKKLKIPFLSPSEKDDATIMKTCLSEEDIYNHAMDLEEGIAGETIDEHLQECSSCRQKFRDAKNIDVAMRQIETPDPRQEKKKNEPPFQRLGSYRVLNFVGQGGMGSVWKAYDEELHRFVAIKVLKDQGTSSGNARLRFKREARAIAKLNHPNIVQVYGAGEEVEHLYIAMEYVNGITLSDAVHDRMLSLEESRNIVLQAALGLREAHENQVLHRDIKPSNMIVDAKQHVKLLDFGLAKTIDDPSVTSTGLIMGTAQYMSPEVAAGKEATVLSDIYSLGMVYYRLLSGKAAFSGSSSLSIIDQIRTKPVTPPSRINRAIDAQTEKIVMKMCAREPADRFQSVDEVINAIENQSLDSLVLDETVESKPVNVEASPRQEKNSGDKASDEEMSLDAKEIPAVMREARNIQNRKENRVSSSAVKDIADDLGIESDSLKEAKAAVDRKKTQKIIYAGLALFGVLIVLQIFFTKPVVTSSSMDSTHRAIDELQEKLDAKNAKVDGTSVAHIHDLMTRKERVSLAVLPFKNLTSDKAHDGLAESCGEALLMPLAQVKKLELIERLQTDKVIGEIDLSRSGYISPQHAIEMGKMHNADLLLTGSLQMVGQKIRISFRILSATTGKLLHTHQITGKNVDIFDMQEKLAQSLRESFK